MITPRCSEQLAAPLHAPPHTERMHAALIEMHSAADLVELMRHPALLANEVSAVVEGIQVARQAAQPSARD